MLTTFAAHHFEVVDYIIILDGSIREQGHWSQLKAKDQQIAKLIHHDGGSYPDEDSKKVAKATARPVANATHANGDLSLYGSILSLSL